MPVMLIAEHQIWRLKKLMRAKSLSHHKRPVSVLSTRSVSRAPRRLVRGRDRDPNQDYVRSLVANLECKNPLELTTAIRELTDIYVSNKYSEVFFSPATCLLKSLKQPSKTVTTLRYLLLGKRFKMLHGVLRLAVFLYICEPQY